MRLRFVVSGAAAALLLSCAAGAAPKSAPARAGSPAPASGPSASARAPGKRVQELGGWPDTRAGEIARRWVTAFSQGEDSMRACLPQIVTPEGLAKHPLSERLESYRKFREPLGTLTLASIDRSSPGEIEATLLASDMSRHRFMFKVQTAPPFKLIEIRATERRMHPGMEWLGGFHH